MRKVRIFPSDLGGDDCIIGGGIVSCDVFRKTIYKEYSYRVFDNDRYKVCTYSSDQKALLELKKGGKISLSLVHFDKTMSN